MIVRNENAKNRQFKGVSFDVLAVGELSMVTRMNYKAGNTVPPHSHPNEQSGYVISGQYRIQYGDTDAILNPGDSYSVPQDVPHSWEVILPGEVIDVFTPIREDYL